MSAHDEAVAAARDALFDDHAERMGMPTRARDLTDEGLRAAVASFEPRAKLAITAYLHHMRAAGFGMVPTADASAAEAAMRERAAKAANDTGTMRGHGTQLEDACDEVAAAIRALPLTTRDET